MFDSERDEIDRLLAHEFTLERELGRGGMGVVYLAQEIRLERNVALKVLLPHAADHEEARERLLREARTAAQLSHPNVVPVFRVIEAGSRIVLVLAFVEGETLSKRVRLRGPLDPKECARILREVAWALGYAHARGIVHRDVKPDNIMIERGSGRAMVMDFGIALREDATALTAAGAMIGSVHFMSPERADGIPASPSSDLYSLGATGYYMLTGTLPIDGPSVASILLRHVTEKPRPLRELRADVPKELAAAIERCLAKKSQDRFETAEAFAEAVAPAVGASLEIPPLIRGWIARGQMLRAIVALWLLPVTLVPTSYLLENFAVAPPVGWGRVFLLRVLFFLVYGALPALAVAFIVRMWDTRVLLSAGFSIEDIRYGLRTWSRQRREERDASRQHRPVSSKVLHGVLFLIAVVMAGWTVAWLILGRLSASEVTNAVIVAVLALGYIGTALNLGDALRSGRIHLWQSKVGPRLLRIAGARRHAARIEASFQRLDALLYELKTDETKVRRTNE